MSGQPTNLEAPETSGIGSDREILKTRARALARLLKRDDDGQGEILKVIEFRLAHERYAVEQKYVREVYPLRELTPLPCTPGFMLGMINVRGQILPVIDVKRFFDLPQAGITDLHTVIIVHIEEMELGILADAVAGVRLVPLSLCQSSLPTLTGIRGKYLKGVTDQHVVILDVPSILNDPKTVVNEEIED
ncbi:MAG TPA: chemotaxis protein CheW [Tepidisphaeraceae bacterium]|jgi:purine-binding chemotaxis protein CheW